MKFGNRAATKNPFLPSKERVAEDQKDAPNSFYEERADPAGPRAIEIKGSKSFQGTSGRIEPFVDDILRYLGHISWETRGFQPEIRKDPSNPLYPVFEAIGLIKSKIDDLLNERKKAEAAYLSFLLLSRTQLHAPKHH